MILIIYRILVINIEICKHLWIQNKNNEYYKIVNLMMYENELTWCFLIGFSFMFLDICSIKVSIIIMNCTYIPRAYDLQSWAIMQPTYCLVL